MEPEVIGLLVAAIGVALASLVMAFGHGPEKAVAADTEPLTQPAEEAKSRPLSSLAITVRLVLLIPLALILSFVSLLSGPVTKEELLDVCLFNFLLIGPLWARIAFLMFAPSRRGRTVRRVAIAMSITAYLLSAGFLQFASNSVYHVRTDSRLAHCMNNLKRLAVAMLEYHDKHGCFPAAYTTDREGHPLHSWRVLLLPYLEEESVYNSIRLDEPWDSPNNYEILRGPQGRAAAKHFWCPFSPDPQTDTHYVMVVGPNTISDGPHSVRQEDITDGASQTIMIAEIKKSGIHWSEPRDLDFNAMSFRANDPDRRGIGSYHFKRAVVVFVVFADARVRTVEDSIGANLLKGLLTINGGEDVSEFFTPAAKAEKPHDGTQKGAEPSAALSPNQRPQPDIESNQEASTQQPKTDN